MNPQFKIQYAKGLGDVLLYLLHISPLRLITHNLLKIKEPCSQCSKRAAALNILFPIPVWKFFFKSHQDLINKLSQDLLDNGYKVNVSPDGNNIASVKTDQKPTILKENKDYILIGSSKNIIGDLLIKTEIYKK
jgi:hypothetical protein